MIPDQLIGTYVLFRNGTEYYIGRSDTCLRRRLLAHCTTARADYFTYDVHPTPELAFAMECSLFHGYRHHLANVLHPDRPDHQNPKCPFCLDSLASTLTGRLRTKNLRK
ncbi:GIY-YIG nuclease family protein [Streptomyces sp. NPDC001156]